MMKLLMKRICSVACCVLLLLTMTATAFAGHTEAEDKEEEATVGAQTEFGYDGLHYTGETEFYLRVLNPKAPVKGNTLPKTGETGVPLELLLIAALVCGSGYLLCCTYEKKHE